MCSFVPFVPNDKNLEFYVFGAVNCITYIISVICAFALGHILEVEQLGTRNVLAKV